MRFVIPIILFILFGGCGTGSDPGSAKISLEGSFVQAGLPGLEVNTLTRFEGNLYAGTDSGLYRGPEASENLLWTSLGLQRQDVLKVVFLQGGKLLAAIRISDFSGSIPSMFLSADDGQSWQVWVNNYGGETGEYTWVESLAATLAPSDTLFARVSGTTVARSINGGQEWHIVNGDWNLWGGAAVLVYSDPHQQGRIFAGGVNAFSSPYLLRSADYGENWTTLSVLENIEAVCYDVLTHPAKSTHILAGLGGAFDQALLIRKSTNGGTDWNTVHQGIITLTLTSSERNPAVVYASGINREGSLFFLASGDFGDTWQTVEYPESPADIQVNDMVSVTEDGREVLYLGTNKGIYSYRFEE
jgi:photosystem II stability/assembly factor-like uncharacterized protein